MAVDAGYAKYSGFNIVNSNGFSDSEIQQHSYLERPDLNLEAISTDVYFLFWTDGFQLADVLGTSPVRGRGQGFLGILSLDKASAHDATGIVPESARPKLSGSSGLTRVDMSLISAQLGYGVSHNWDGLFLNALMSYGAGLQRVSYNSDDGEHVKSGLATKFSMKAAFGYADQRWFGGLLAGLEEPKYKLKDIYVETSRQQLMLFAGSRF